MKSYHDIAGDGGSAIALQVGERRERMVQRLAGVRSLLAIGSGKGGVGKSTLTRRIGLALRARDRRVAILDADLNGPAQARLAGLEDAPLVPGRGGLAIPVDRTGIGVVSFGALFPEPRAVEFDSVSTGDSHTWRATREFTALEELMLAVDWGALDVLLVDLPPGAERTRQLAEFFGPRAAFVVVTLPSDLARGVVARSVTALRQTPNRLLGYVENMSGYYCAECGAVKPLFPSHAATALDLPCLGHVPFDPRLAAACDAGGAAPSGTACDDAVQRVADGLLGMLEER